MISRLFFVTILILTACGQIKSTPENNTVSATHDSVKDTVNTDVIKSFPDSSKIRVKADSDLTCEKLLYSLVNGSTFNPEVKKFKFKVSVNELADGIATLKVTMRNTERNEDMAIGWLKMDINKNQLLDVTSDPDNPEELKYDSILFKKVIKHCGF